MSCGTPDTGLSQTLSLTGLLPPLEPLSNGLQLEFASIAPVHTPRVRRPLVWALSISLAATLKIDVSFSSSGYLDVSVHRVPSAALFIHAAVTALHDRRVPPFGYPWLFARLQLPMAFRSLPRPSSALGTKASTLRSF